jgi:GT2 family glycosyltransferase
MSKILIQCVVVIYKCSLEQSRTLHSLATFCRQQKGLAQQIALLIYDNSPDPQVQRLDEWSCGAIQYCHSSENGGLAAAYNHALTMAQYSGIEWLLLLDQDSVFDSAFFPALMAAIASPLPAEICAMVPKVFQDARILSPGFVTRFRKHYVPATFSGMHRKPIVALNSGACLRVKNVTAVGGFPREYWLDYLDHIMFYRLQAAGGRIWVLDVELQHRLSFQNMETEMSVNRYRSLLAAEWGYIRESGEGGGSLVHRFRLMRRALGQVLKHKNNAYAKLSFAAAFGAPMVYGSPSSVKRDLLGRP